MVRRRAKGEGQVLRSFEGQTPKRGMVCEKEPSKRRRLRCCDHSLNVIGRFGFLVLRSFDGRDA